MKKHLLVGLLSISYATGYAAAPPNPTPLSKEALQPPTQNMEVTPPPITEPNTTTTTTKQVESTGPEGTTSTTKQVETTVPADASGNSTTSTTTTTTVSTPPPQGPVDCNYHIPAETTVSRDLVLKWAEKAAIQSFNFDYNAITGQLVALKGCYTDQGWQSFNEALEKSGNLDTIKNQMLTVTSTLNGTTQITEVKDNQWKVNVPIQVNYENRKEKVAQQLIINLIVGRKLSGDLGIMQMVAIPSDAPKNNLPATLEKRTGN